MRRLITFSFLLFIIYGCFTACQNKTTETTTLTAKKWDKVTLIFKGTPTSETAEDNPFLNYRLNVTFKLIQTNKTIVFPINFIPSFFS